MVFLFYKFMIQNTKFDGLWLPMEIYLLDIGIKEKICLAFIIILLNEKGECYESNDYFSKILNLSPTRCSSIIKLLAFCLCLYFIFVTIYHQKLSICKFLQII